MQNSKPPRSVPKRRDSSLSHAYAVIMAGGSGTRFWPLSRRKRPKQLLELFGRDTLLEQTAARIRSLIPPERTYVDPDCGLKTRTVDEAKEKLKVIVQGARQVRQELGLE